MNDKGLSPPIIEQNTGKYHSKDQWIRLMKVREHFLSLHRILQEAISNAVPVHTLEPDDLQKLDHRLDYLLMRTADHLAAAGHDSPLDGTKELLWTKIRDFTSADLARVKRRRMERAAAPDTVSWH